MIKKRCETCGHVRAYYPGARRCRAIVERVARGLQPRRGVYCWGTLRVVPKRKVRATLEQKLMRAHGELVDAITRVKRATTSVSHWPRRIKYLERAIDSRDHPQPKAPRKPARIRPIVIPPEDATASPLARG